MIRKLPEPEFGWREMLSIVVSLIVAFTLIWLIIP